MENAESNKVMEYLDFENFEVVTPTVHVGSHMEQANTVLVAKQRANS